MGFRTIRNCLGPGPDGGPRMVSLIAPHPDSKSQHDLGREERFKKKKKPLQLKKKNQSHFQKSVGMHALKEDRPYFIRNKYSRPAVGSVGTYPEWGRGASVCKRICTLRLSSSL